MRVLHQDVCLTKSHTDLVMAEYKITDEVLLFATAVTDYSLPHEEEWYFTFQFLGSHGV